MLKAIAVGTLAAIAAAVVVLFLWVQTVRPVCWTETSIDSITMFPVKTTECW